MYKKVVVLLDGSPLAEQVLPHVAEIIKDRGSEVYLLSVAPTVVTAMAAPADIQPAFATTDYLVVELGEQEKIARELTDYLDKVAQDLRPLAEQVSRVIRFGRPAEEILSYADKVGADLIAMCTHGRSGLGRWVYGSVADKVLRGAKCPVLLVRVQPKD
jgi:nucleotide-binding universal stress UspA family protein